MADKYTDEGFPDSRSSKSVSSELRLKILGQKSTQYYHSNIQSNKSGSSVLSDLISVLKNHIKFQNDDVKLQLNNLDTNFNTKYSASQDIVLNVDLVRLVVSAMRFSDKGPCIISRIYDPADDHKNGKCIDFKMLDGIDFKMDTCAKDEKILDLVCQFIRSLPSNATYGIGLPRTQYINELLDANLDAKKLFDLEKANSKFICFIYNGFPYGNKINPEKINLTPFLRKSEHEKSVKLSIEKTKEVSNKIVEIDKKVSSYNSTNDSFFNFIISEYKLNGLKFTKRDWQSYILAVLDSTSREKIAQAIIAAESNGAIIQLLFADGRNHLHVQIQK